MVLFLPFFFSNSSHVSEGHIWNQEFAPTNIHNRAIKWERWLFMERKEKVLTHKNILKIINMCVSLLRGQSVPCPEACDVPTCWQLFYSTKILRTEVGVAMFSAKVTLYRAGCKFTPWLVKPVIVPCKISSISEINKLTMHYSMTLTTHNLIVIQRISDN